MVRRARRLLTRLSHGHTDGASRAPTPASMTRGWEIGRATARGARTENQDRARTGPGWLVVCDGVGGHAGGARAADLALHAAAAALAVEGGLAPGRDAVQAAHRAVRHGQIDPAVHEMATTVTVARAVGDGSGRWIVTHVEDSPAWRVAYGRATQITEDHTVAGALLASGAISPEAAAGHAGRRFVTRVAGAREVLEPDVVEVDLGAATSLVVATDGISDVLRPDEVAAAVEGAPDAAGASQAVVDAALAAGTHDNATAVVVRPGRTVAAEARPAGSRGER